MLSVAMSVSPFSAGDLRSIFYYWRSVLIESARKQAFLGLVFSCFAFLMFLLSGNHPERVCAVVFLRAFILFASFLSTVRCFGVLRQGLQGGLASDGLVPGRLCRVDFTGSALLGWLCLPSARSDRFRREDLHRIGFVGSACAVRPTRTRARGGCSHGSSRDVCLTVKHINALNRCFIE